MALPGTEVFTEYARHIDVVNASILNHPMFSGSYEAQCPPFFIARQLKKSAVGQVDIGDLTSFVYGEKTQYGRRSLVLFFNPNRSVAGCPLIRLNISDSTDLLSP